MSESSASSNHDESSTELSAAEALCTLGSLSGEHTIELSQMTREGDPIPEAPHISIWTNEPNPDNGDPLATGVLNLIKSPKDDDYPPYIVKASAPHHYWFDYDDLSIPSGLDVDETGDESRLWFGRFDTLEDGIEALVAAAEQLANATRAT